ncbi:EF-hand domain-containing protein [Rhodanobacter panaciterrae]|uniref:EF-hand domain-containing protein n=1 Tax=Rhodanobacter panaciterrae TaxID=490572 RepID=UPI00167A89D9|nr:EF-hand domain-containing protein [Rhodanobacter panaciterrae]
MKRQGSAKICIALAMVASSPFIGAVAQSITPENVTSSPLYFPNIDKNHDGFISRSELPKDLHDLRAHFDQYDLNKDHRLSSAEYSTYLKTLAAGACNSARQSTTEANCSQTSGMGSQPDARPDMGTVYLPPPPPPSGGH